MKVIINGYEVELKARNTYGNKKRMNKEDTMAVLNILGMWAGEATERYKTNGLNALARRTREDAHNLYTALEAEGYYKNI